MNAEDQSALKMTRGTARSWRAMRVVFCWICSAMAAVVAFFNVYADADLHQAIATQSAVEASGLTGEPLERALENISYTVPVRNYVVRGAFYGVLAGAGAWVGAWLIILAVAFMWWFILDRIREFARAIKGQP